MLLVFFKILMLNNYCLVLDALTQFHNEKDFNIDNIISGPFLQHIFLNMMEKLSPQIHIHNINRHSHLSCGCLKHFSSFGRDIWLKLLTFGSRQLSRWTMTLVSPIVFTLYCSLKMGTRTRSCTWDLFICLTMDCFK